MITTSIIMFLTFAGSLYLEAMMKTYYKPEMFILGLAELFGFILLVAEAAKARWEAEFMERVDQASAELGELIKETKSLTAEKRRAS